MKIGFLKIGARLTWDSKDKTGGIGEAKAIIEMLSKDNECNVYTKILKNENINPKANIFIKEIKDISEIKDDVLLVFNGNVNFFGGAEDPEQIKNYILINNFKKEIYYIFIDPELYLKQIWKSISKKPLAGKYKEEEVFISRKDINVITSIYTDEGIKKANKGGVDISKIHFFPFEKYPLLNDGLEINEDLEYDLMYMGTFRGGKRQDKMIKFYFGHTAFNSTFIGKTKLQDFKKKYKRPEPEFLPPVDFSEIKYEINKSVAHVCIGDKFYEGNIITPRIYECILYSTVCLIDHDMDPERRVFKHPTLLKFNYVKDNDGVSKRIILLKSNPKLRDKIIKLQKEDVNFSADKYLEDLETEIIPL